MYPQSMFRAKIRRKKIAIYHLKSFVFTAVKNCILLHRRVCVMYMFTAVVSSGGLANSVSKTIKMNQDILLCRTANKTH